MRESSADNGHILARLDRIQTWPYPTLVLVSLGMGFFFAFYDMVAIGLVLPTIEKAFAISAKSASLTITSGLIGYVIGSFLNSRLSDRFGRKLGLYISISLFSIGSLLCALSQSLYALSLWRFISGMGLGAEIAIATTLLNEIAPANYRGQYTSRAVAFGMFGFAIMPFVGLLIVPNFTWGWRALFIIGGLGGFVIAMTRKFIPESPRWLIARGRFDEANEIVTQAENYARQCLGKELPPIQLIETPPLQHYPLRRILQAPYLNHLILFTVIWFIYYLGNYAWLTLSTNLFIEEGFQLASSIGLVAMSSVGFIFGSFIPVFYGDRIERKTYAAIVAIIWAIALFLIGWFPTPWMIAVNGFIASTTIAAIIPIMYTYTAENFPATLRATCVSVSDGLGHIGGAICGQVVFAVFALFKSTGFGFTAAFSFMALTGLITAGLLLCGTKMTGRALTS